MVARAYSVVVIGVSNHPLLLPYLAYIPFLVFSLHFLNAVFPFYTFFYYSTTSGKTAELVYLAKLTCLCTRTWYCTHTVLYTLFLYVSCQGGVAQW